MLDNLPTAAFVMAAFALVTIAMPGPVMIDMLGVGLASLGLGMFYDRC